MLDSRARAIIIPQGHSPPYKTNRGVSAARHGIFFISSILYNLTWQVLRLRVEQWG